MNFMLRQWNIVIIGLIKKNRFFIQTLKHKFSLCESTCTVIILLEHHLRGEGGGLKCAEGNGKDGGVWDNLPWENGALIWNQIEKFRQQKYSR
jgi:hypothetical protein